MLALPPLFNAIWYQRFSDLEPLSQKKNLRTNPPKAAFGRNQREGGARKYGVHPLMWCLPVSHIWENAMERFIHKHTGKITGTIACFDRVLFKGYLPISWAQSMESFMATKGFLIKDFKALVSRQSQRVKEHAKRMAEVNGRPYREIRSARRKEKEAWQIAIRDGITRGLVCVLAAVEGCSSFRVVRGEKRPRLINAKRKCLCLYFYFMDRDFGFMHVRITTWFPFTVQICLNGHHWLAGKMDRAGIGYGKLDNAFVWIEDPKRAQRLANRFVKKNWPRILQVFAQQVNPLTQDLLKHMTYYWIVEQAEFATDVMFKDRATLKPLYQALLRHATLCFSAEDVMTFLGRKLHGRFEGELLSSYKKRWPGARIKHQIKNNGIKMYDKHGSGLRIETIINDPYEFKIRRRGRRQGKEIIGWFPMAKGVANLYRYEEICFGANRRYLEALAAVEDPAKAQKSLRKLASPVRQRGRSYRGFNPASQKDAELFAAVLRGEHHIMGLRNADIRRQLFRPTNNPRSLRGQSARVSRLLKQLHVHGLIAKVPRSRRWRITPKGQTIMTMAMKLYHEEYLQTLTKQAA